MSLYIFGRIHCHPSETVSLSVRLSDTLANMGIEFGFDPFEEVEDRSFLLAEGYAWPSGDFLPNKA